MPPIGRSAVVEVHLDAAAAGAHVARRALHLARVPRQPARRGGSREIRSAWRLTRSAEACREPSCRHWANPRSRSSKRAPLSRAIGRFNGIRRARVRSNYLIASGYRLAADQPAGRDGPHDCRRFEKGSTHCARPSRVAPTAISASISVRESPASERISTLCSPSRGGSRRMSGSVRLKRGGISGMRIRPSVG